MQAVSDRVHKRYENLMFKREGSLSGHQMSMPHELGELYWHIGDDLKVNINGYQANDLDIKHGVLDLALELINGKSLNLVQKLDARELESFCRDQNHVPAFDNQDMAENVFETVSKLMRISLNLLNPVVCTCNQVRYKEIEDLIRLEGITDYKEIVSRTNAASACGSCISKDTGKRAFYITDILNSTLAKMRSKFYDEPAFKNVEKLGLPSLAISLSSGEKIYDSLKLGAYSDLKTMDKIKYINEVFDKKVRPFLQQDGGDIELTDVDELMVFVTYHGACGTCSSSTSGTLEFITKVLRNEFGEKLVVIVED